MSRASEKLEPKLLTAFSGSTLVKGKLVTLSHEPDFDKAQALEFQYNPESITRTRSGQWEHKENKKGAPAPQDRTLADGMRGGGLYAKSESIQLKLIFDATEGILSGTPDVINARPPPAKVASVSGGVVTLEEITIVGDPNGPDEVVEEQRFASVPVENSGVLPELAVLERMAIGKEGEKEEGGDKSKKKDKLDMIAPMALLLCLGDARRFPVVVTMINIVEQKFTPKLIPMRAEVDIRFRVLENIEVASEAVTATAFTVLMKQRKDLSESYYPFEADEYDTIAKALKTEAEK